MTYYLRIDSVTGSTDSVKLYRYADIGYRVVRAGDTVRAFPIMHPTWGGDMNVYYYAPSTLYTSLIMCGTPDSVGEPYFCSYTADHLFWFDNPCTYTSGSYYGGSDPMDTVTGCSVLDGATLRVLTPNSREAIYPNPTNGYLTITYNALTNDLFDFQLLNVAGGIVFDRRLNSLNNSETIDIRHLPTGVYLYKLLKNGHRYLHGKINKL
jgi:hypothetical protein